MVGVGGGSVTRVQWVEVKDSVQHPTTHGAAPYSKEFFGSKCQGTGYHKDQAMIRSLEFSAPISYSSEKGEGLEMELMSDCAYMMNPPQKSQCYVVWGASGLVVTFMNQEVPTP